MEFVAVTPHKAEIYSWSGGDAPKEPLLTLQNNGNKDSMPVFTEDGKKFALLCEGNLHIYDCENKYKELLVIQQQCNSGGIRAFFFSPLNTYIVTWEAFKKDTERKNLILWDASTGEELGSWKKKEKTEVCWPPIQWTDDEEYVFRWSTGKVLKMKASDFAAGKDDTAEKLKPDNVAGFKVSPTNEDGGNVACFTYEIKGIPAHVKIVPIRNVKSETARKNFFNAQTASMFWNKNGTAVLIKADTDKDVTGQSYYGTTTLYFLRADGSNDACLRNANDGQMHAVAWSPCNNEFAMVMGHWPADVGVFNGSNANKIRSYGTAKRNTIVWQPGGRNFLCAGFGNLAGDVDVHDRSIPETKPVSSKAMGTVKVEWSPDGEYWVGGVLAPRMRTDNHLAFFAKDSKEPIFKMEYEELLDFSWRPNPDVTPDSQPILKEIREADKKAKKGAGKGGNASGGYAAPTFSGYIGSQGAFPKTGFGGGKGAYKPPGQRGGIPGMEAAAPKKSRRRRGGGGGGGN